MEPVELTARDIAAKTFNDAWRGYDQKEVDDFLDRVGDALATAERAAEEMRAHSAETAERARRIEEDAARRVAEAEAATRALGDHHLVEERRRLESSIERLERFRAELKLRLSAFLEGQSQALEELARAPAGRPSLTADKAGGGRSVVRLDDEPDRFAAGRRPRGRG